MAAYLDRQGQTSKAAGERFFLDYESTNSERGLWSLLWDSIRSSKLDTGLANDLTFDLESLDSPEFTLYEDEQYSREVSPAKREQLKLTKGLSKTARERKAARERKVAKLVKYRRNTKLIRTRKNKSGTRNPWSSSKKESEEAIASLILPSLEVECSSSNMSTLTADTNMMPVAGAMHQELKISGLNSVDSW